MRKWTIGAAVISWVLLTDAIAQDSNPSMPGFDAAGSDARAIELADDVMAALGGRRAWDETRYLTWNFFGRRTHVWDKHTGNLRFDNGERVVLMNLNDKTGRVFDGGAELTDPEALKEALEAAESAWINDSYWVFMPFKLKDTGVTLNYIGSGETAAGAAAEIVQLTFAGVGRTPENKYHVYIDASTRLVTQWDYYQNASDPEPRFQIPWNDWTRHGDVLLSADRGERQHENVAVLADVPDSVFESPGPVSILDFRK